MIIEIPIEQIKEFKIYDNYIYNDREHIITWTLINHNQQRSWIHIEDKKSYEQKFISFENFRYI
jgi:23S rRNA A1618 N6-methylase RlmF